MTTDIKTQVEVLCNTLTYWAKWHDAYQHEVRALLTKLVQVNDDLRIEQDRLLDIIRELIQRDLPTESRDKNRQIVQLTNALQTAEARLAVQTQAWQVAGARNQILHKALTEILREARGPHADLVGYRICNIADIALRNLQ